MHPLFRQVQPILDEMGGLSDDDPNVLLVVPPYTVPSSKFMQAAYPSSLPLHLLETITPTFERRLKPKDSDTSLSASIDTIRGGPPDPSKDDSSNANTHSRSNSNTFLGMPGMNVTMNKWNWPGYLTFGKSSNKRPPEIAKPPEDAPSAEKGTDDQVESVAPAETSGVPQESASNSGTVQEDVTVDTASLEEAVNDQLIPPMPPSEETASPRSSNAPGDEVPPSQPPALKPPDQGEQSIQGPSFEKEGDANPKDEEEVSRAPSPPAPEPLPDYSFVHVNLHDNNGPESTTRQPVFYFTHQVRLSFTFAYHPL